MGFLSWFKADSFCFIFSLQSGTVMSVLVLAALTLTSMFHVMYFLVITSSLVTHIVPFCISYAFMVVLMVGIILAFVGAYTESSTWMITASIFTGVAVLLYIVIAILSFFPSFMEHVCFVTRCPDHLWLQDSYWRAKDLDKVTKPKKYFGNDNLKKIPFDHPGGRRFKVMTFPSKLEMVKEFGESVEISSNDWDKQTNIRRTNLLDHTVGTMLNINKSKLFNRGWKIPDRDRIKQRRPFKNEDDEEDDEEKTTTDKDKEKNKDNDNDKENEKDKDKGKDDDDDEDGERERNFKDSDDTTIDTYYYPDDDSYGDPRGSDNSTSPKDKNGTHGKYLFSMIMTCIYMVLYIAFLSYVFFGFLAFANELQRELYGYY